MISDPTQGLAPADPPDDVAAIKAGLPCPPEGVAWRLIEAGWSFGKQWRVGPKMAPTSTWSLVQGVAFDLQWRPAGLFDFVEYCTLYLRPVDASADRPLGGLAAVIFERMIGPDLRTLERLEKALEVDSTLLDVVQIGGPGTPTDSPPDDVEIGGEPTGSQIFDLSSLQDIRQLLADPELRPPMSWRVRSAVDKAYRLGRRVRENELRCRYEEMLADFQQRYKESQDRGEQTAQKKMDDKRSREPVIRRLAEHILATEDPKGNYWKLAYLGERVAAAIVLETTRDSPHRKSARTIAKELEAMKEYTAQKLKDRPRREN